MRILSDEFSRQAAMESELAIPTSLMAPPKKDILSLGNAQCGFMSLFAIPLFQGVADILPDMQYCVDELELNKRLFEQCIADEIEKQKGAQNPREVQDGTLSPTSLSAAQQASQASRPGLSELSSAPGSVEANPSRMTKDSTSQHTELADRPAEGPETSTAYREANGIVTAFDAVADFARSDPFHADGGDKMHGPTKQRCSETTEGSSAPYSGDWASQATSATTGKMPLSPSTQGTSIVSRDSLDRPNSVPVTTITAPESTTTVPESAKSQHELKSHHSHQGPLQTTELMSLNWGHRHHGPVNGTAAKSSLQPPPAGLEQPNGKTLKKKGSRFRINPLPFIRRHLSSSPPLHSADTAG